MEFCDANAKSICEKHFQNIIDCVTRRCGVRPRSRNEVGLVVVVGSTATLWFMQLVLTATTTLVVFTVLELTKRSYQSDSDTRQN